MARWISAGAIFFAACGFQAAAIHGDAGIGDNPPGAPGTEPGTEDDILYVGTADQYTGSGDLTIAAPIAIDTGAMAFGMPLPPGVTFSAAKQDGGGPDLAILHVQALAVHADLRAFGARPLVVLADSFELTETIDVSAHRADAGPGALAARDLAGGRPPGLVGGAGGVAPASASGPCQVVPPGAGGGAIEVYARTRISISGNIDAGGGGGFAGACPSVLAPNPGGAGGTIVLQSPIVDNAGRLSANAGAGPVASGDLGGGANPGQILMLYRTKLAPGTTTPTAVTRSY